MKRRLALVAVAATALAGCMWLGQPAAVEPVAPPGPAGAGAGNADPSGLGTLRIRVKWPARDLPNFHAQVIPLRTRAIRLTTNDGSSAEIDSRLLVRAPGVTEASASIYLAPGDGYSVVAEAFADESPAAGATPIAQGTAANLPIRAGKILQVPITLTAAYAPAITGLTPDTSGIGTEIQISGTNFGATLGLDFAVTFNGVSAQATRSSDTAAVAKVPLAPSGNVVVSVDGVPSASTAPFAVTDGLLSALLSSFEIFEHTGLLVSLGEAAGAKPTPVPTPAPGGLGATIGSANSTATPVPTPSAGSIGVTLQ